MISIDGGPPVAVPRPSLLGAILIKARVVAKARKEKFDSDRQDLILLLSLVEDPRGLASADELDFSDTALLDAFTAEQLTRRSLHPPDA